MRPRLVLQDPTRGAWPRACILFGRWLTMIPTPSYLPWGRPSPQAPRARMWAASCLPCCTMTRTYYFARVRTEVHMLYPSRWQASPSRGDVELGQTASQTTCTCPACLSWPRCTNCETSYGPARYSASLAVCPSPPRQQRAVLQSLKGSLACGRERPDSCRQHHPSAPASPI
jgi:hypothetical protein